MSRRAEFRCDPPHPKLIELSGIVFGDLRQLLVAYFINEILERPLFLGDPPFALILAFPGQS
jgi:hypothetical protein